MCMCVCASASVHHKVDVGKEKSEQESKERRWVWKAGVEEKMPLREGGFYEPLRESYNEEVFPRVVRKIRLGKQESDHKGLEFYAK